MPDLVKIIEKVAGVDLARKAYYDRNSDTKVGYWGGGVAAHGWTERLSYTVPSNKKALMGICFGVIAQTIVTAGRVALIKFEYEGNRFFQCTLADTGDYLASEMHTLTFLLKETDILKGYTIHTDTVNHDFSMGYILTEFDE